MRVLFVWPGADFSIWDVGLGLRAALIAAGADVRDYYVTKRMNYHAAAMKAGGIEAPDRSHVVAISKQACENIVVEALYHRADLVVMVCGLNVHPAALQLLRAVGIRTALVLTESPYEDFAQASFCAHYPEATVFTNDLASARLFGWHHLPPAYDPARHHPQAANAEDATDVLFIGSGWAERVELFRQVDWTGINFRWIGPIVGGAETLPVSLAAHHQDHCVSNQRAAELYAATKIGLNLHRSSDIADTANPRAYELAACGVFQVSDARPGLVRLLGSAAVTFENARELERHLRYYLREDSDRESLAARQRSLVLGETFDARVQTLLSIVQRSAAA
jgi:spore maturation protein CgeB